MATLDLSAIDERLRWADDHAARVATLSGTWAADALRTSTTTDSERGVRVFRAEIVGDPPVTIALALGDVLHHARAALDNLVALLRGGPSDRSQFRLDEDPTVFDRDDGGRLEGVPPWAVAAIRQIQPFPGNPWGHIGVQLLKLHRLAIVDRHRALLLSGALIDLDRTHAATSHPGETQFHIRDGGRVLTLEYPEHAQVSPATGAQVIVREEGLRWPDRIWPAFPSADDVATSALRAVRVAIDVARHAAVANVTLHNAD